MMKMERHILVCDMPTNFTATTTTNGEAIDAYLEYVGRDYLPVTVEIKVDELIRYCNRPTVAECVVAARSLPSYEQQILLAEFCHNLDFRFDDNLLTALTALDMRDRRLRG